MRRLKPRQAKRGRVAPRIASPWLRRQWCPCDCSFQDPVRRANITGNLLLAMGKHFSAKISMRPLLPRRQKRSLLAHWLQLFSYLGKSKRLVRTKKTYFSRVTAYRMINKSCNCILVPLKVQDAWVAGEGHYSKTLSHNQCKCVLNLYVLF